MARKFQRDTRSGDKQVADQERKLKALECRKSGMTYEQIRVACGYSTRDAAHKCVMRTLDEMVREPADAVRELELARLDRMLEGLAKRRDENGQPCGAFDGDPKAVLATVKLMERRAKYLGLDAPEKVEHSMPELHRMTDEELQTLALASTTALATTQ